MDEDHLQGKEMPKGKMIEEALQIAEEEKCKAKMKAGINPSESRVLKNSKER